MVFARLALLALYVAGCQCLTPPAILAGRRVQFFTQKSDGGYKYGFDTADGHFQEQGAGPSNEVRGQFGAEGGKTEYTSGVDGFKVISYTKPTSTREYVPPARVRFATLEELNTPPKPVADTREVAAAKAQFKADYDAAAAAAAAAPDVDIITGAVPVFVKFPARDPAYDNVRYSGPLAPLDASGKVQETAEVKAARASLRAAYAGISTGGPAPVEDTAEVKAAKVAFRRAYDAAAAAAAAAPDDRIITGPPTGRIFGSGVTIPSKAPKSTYVYFSDAPATPPALPSLASTDVSRPLVKTSSVRFSGPLAPLDASGRVLETAEVKAAKAAFQQAFKAAEAAVSNTGTAAARGTATFFSSGDAVAHGGSTRSYNLDGFTVRAADGIFSPQMFGYTYE